VLFDPLEEEFDLPATLIQSGDLRGRQKEIVGQENQTLGMLKILVTDAAQVIGITAERIKTLQPNGLIANHSGGGFHPMRIEPSKAEIATGPGNEESRSPMNAVKANRSPDKLDRRCKWLPVRKTTGPGC